MQISNNSHLDASAWMIVFHTDLMRTPLSIRYRLAVLSRAAAAVLGGYAVASLFAYCLALALPIRRADAVLTGMLSSFAIFLIAVIWVFAARTALRAWCGLLLPIAGLAVGSFVLRHGAL